MSSSKKAKSTTSPPGRPSVGAAVPAAGARTSSPAARKPSSTAAAAAGDSKQPSAVITPRSINPPSGHIPSAAAGSPARRLKTGGPSEGSTAIASDPSKRATGHATRSTHAAAPHADGVATITRRAASPGVRAQSPAKASSASAAAAARGASPARTPNAARRPSVTGSSSRAALVRSPDKVTAPAHEPPAPAARRGSASAPTTAAVTRQPPPAAKQAPVAAAAAARRVSGSRPAASPQRPPSPARVRSQHAGAKTPAAKPAGRASAGAKAGAPAAALRKAAAAGDAAGGVAAAPRRSTVESVVTTPTPPAAAASAPVPPGLASQVAWEVMRPQNQMQLTEAELEEDIPKSLVATTVAHAPTDHVRWSLVERDWKRNTSVNPVLIHYSSQGRLLHRTSDAAQQQLKAAGPSKAAATQAAPAGATLGDAPAAAATADASSAGQGPDAAKDGQEATAEAAPGATAYVEPVCEAAAVLTESSVRKLRNALNFQVRHAQTVSSGGKMRDADMMTQPPATNTIAGSCSRVTIYEAYARQLEAKRVAAEEKAKQEKESKRPKGKDKDGEPPIILPSKAQLRAKQQAEHIAKASHTLERMVNQNAVGDVAMDMQYWDDESDALRPKEGTLLPLYRFVRHKTKQKAVTALVWHPHHSDYFAAGYGTFDYQRQGSGAIACYTLKNVMSPEHHFTLDSGVLCLDFNREQPHLLAVGCHDGTVCVFDLRSQSEKPVCRSAIDDERHTEGVWAVTWRPPDLQAAVSFAAVSTDGYVTVWKLHRGKLSHRDLKALDPPAVEGKAPELRALATMGPDLEPVMGGMCLDFRASGGGGSADQEDYLVGLESGDIVKCNTAFNKEYMATFTGHNMPVYTAQWNKLHKRTFVSCSADGTVKVWDEVKTDKHVLYWELGAAVGDVAWSPYSSTTFAAVTLDGKVHVYDLDKNIMAALCVQKIARKAKLTKLAFNPRLPIITIGDEKGIITVLKLSPNLRQIAKPIVPQTKNSGAKGGSTGGSNIARLMGNWQEPTTVASTAEADAAPKPTQLELEVAKMEALLKDIELHGTIRFDD